jgi:hypothetical protein
MRLPPKDDNFENVYRKHPDAVAGKSKANEWLRLPRQKKWVQDIFRDETGSEEEEEEYEYDYAMSLSELLYSTSSFYAIIVPGELI